MNSLLNRQLREHPGRYVATAIAVAISVAFITIAIGLGRGMAVSQTKALTEHLTGVDVVLRNGGGDTSALDVAAALTGAPGIAAASAEMATFGQAISPTARADLRFDHLLAPELRWQRIISGDWPAGPGEVALEFGTAQTLEVGIGDTIDVSSGGEGPTIEQLRVVGIVAPYGPGGSRGLITPDALDTYLFSTMYSSVLVAGVGDPADTSPQRQADTSAAAMTALAAAGIQDWSVSTKDAEVEMAQSQVFGSVVTLQAVVLAFAAVALIVCAIVISTTFRVLVVQRTRQLGLLRCLGAKRAQIRRLVLGETAAVGLAGAALGALLGVGATLLIYRAMRVDAPLATLVMPVLVGLAAGLTTTLVAGLGPLRQAVAVSPLAGLRPVEQPVTMRLAVRRLTVGLVVTVVGAAIIGFGNVIQNLFVSVVGGSLALIGAVVVTSVVAPYAVAWLGRVLGRRMPEAGLAGANVARAPGRAGATVAGIVVGVALVTMFTVGAESVRASASAQIDIERPVDFTVWPYDEVISDADVATIAELPGVVATAPARSLMLDEVLLGGDVAHVQVFAVGPQFPGVVRTPSQTPAPGTAVVAAPSSGADTVTLTAGDQSVTVPAVVGATPDTVILVAHDVAAALGQGDPNVLFVRIEDGQSGEAVQDLASAIATAVPDVGVSGGASDRAYFTEMLDNVLLVVLALLGAAVLISVIGVSNTLGLSVVERRRDNALLRALGLRTGQVRLMLVWEAVLLGVVAVAFGLVTGTALAVAGVYALAPIVQMPVLLSLPGIRLVAIAAVALAAAMIAARTPGRRAARMSPVMALAAE